MRTRSLLLFLLLYAALAWVWAAYKYAGEQIVEKGLLWTAIGIGAVIAALILERAWGWYRNWQARRAKEPALSRPVRPVHEDDAALATLWDEARANLAASPAYGLRGRNLNLNALPMFLVVGPAGSGKSSTLINSGIEPQLLAGQTRADNHIAPTRVANIFLSPEALFAEIAGRIWEGDLERWTSFLRGFSGESSVPWWRRLWKDQPRKPQVRGVILFEDFSAFPEKADSQKMSRLSRRDQERLRAISEVFGVSMPVYAVFAKTDSVAFFEDFFARFPEPECGQPLGAALSVESSGGVPTSDHLTRRFTRAFNTVGAHLAERRVLHLSRESDTGRKPGIYEFPREFRRGRTALIQFLSEVFRPNPLKASPFLRGFYFTGTRMIEAVPAPAATTAWATVPPGSTGAFKADATMIFRADATEIFRPGNPESSAASPNQGLKPRWMFARQIFEEIVPHDRMPQRTAVPGEERIERLRRIGAVAICGIAVLACLIWIWSWSLNRGLIADVERIAGATSVRGRQPDGPISLSALEQLEKLREKLVSLGDGSTPMRMRWGLYVGDSLRVPIRRLYFDRFNTLILGDLNRFVVDRLGGLPEKPAPADLDEPAYSQLRTHLKITGTSCQTDPAIVAGVLKAAALKSGMAAEGTHQGLVDKQIDYYAAALREDMPVRTTENAPAVARAREYISQIKSPVRIYAGIRDEVTSKLKGTLRLADTVPEYKQVLTGEGEMPEFFSPKGRELFEQEVKNPKSKAGADACVLGATRSAAHGPDAEREIRTLYVEDYKAKWKEFLARFKVQQYAGLVDAARKLEILSGHGSPILGLLAFTANNTYFAGQSRSSEMGESLIEKGKKLLVKKADPVGKKLEKLMQPDEPKESPAQVTNAFQPVHAVVAPGSEKWVWEANKAYVDALADFRRALQEIARSTSPTPDPAVHQAAQVARDKAFETVRQLAQAFEPVGTDGIDTQVRDLLDQPIRHGSKFIISDPGKHADGKLNTALAGLCGVMRPVLIKYPFARNATSEASLDEVARLFAPGLGAVWKYEQDSLAEFVVRQQDGWARKPDVQKPKVSQAVIDFLNRSQQIRDLYGAGTSRLNLQYTLGTSSVSLDQRSLEFNFDGGPVTYSKDQVLRKTFHWPPPTGHRAVARIVTSGGSYGFAGGDGIWGVFRVFADAETRQLNDKHVEWKYNRGAGGQKTPMDPPVRMEFKDLPGGKDLFNPEFFGGLQCPGRAVQ